MAKESTVAAVDDAERGRELGLLVDGTEQGFLFRRDLPFPGHVRCRVERRTTFTNGRVFIRNELGAGAAPFNVTMEQILVAERDGAKLSLAIERNRVGHPVVSSLEKGMEKGKKTGLKGWKFWKDEESEKVAAPSGDVPRPKTDNRNGLVEGVELQFVHLEGGWRFAGKGGDFRAMTAGRQIEPALGERLGSWGLVSRSPWFGERRFAEGDEVVLVGKQIALVTGTHVKKGRVTLRFEKMEMLEGHPCAVFSWSGAYDEDAPDLEGDRRQSEVSVSEGRLWCSLLHPLVLRNEFKGAVTMIVRDSRGKMKKRIQGAVETTEFLLWNPLAEEAEKG
jgi:hypothetical protein